MKISSKSDIIFAFDFFRAKDIYFDVLKPSACSLKTRMHSGRMRTARHSGCPSCHTYPTATHTPFPHMPPTLPCMPLPLPHMPPCHAHPHAMYASLPCTPHPLTCTPPCGQTDTCENITFANFVYGR